MAYAVIPEAPISKIASHDVGGILQMQDVVAKQ